MAKDLVSITCGHCDRLETLDLIHPKDEIPPRVRLRCQRGHNHVITGLSLAAALETLYQKRAANPAIKARLVAGVDV